ncbi:MAG: SpoIID/LytB domain-containing protein [Candidatus Marinimicrobia bacterium]|nr:SpoIID/LytB domain-containing protein [Candidatus Neomarinimicrobiota bacterium]
MLNPDIIPSVEPIIRVGVVLPEDNFKILSLTVPEKPDYFLMNASDEKFSLHAGDQIEVSYHNKVCALSINGKLTGIDNRWKVIPDDDIQMENKAGLKIQEVVSGRGFHWQKNIAVYVSGIVEISPLEDSLILVNELPIEEYLMCVATSEMGRECPRELIESQTITARSWMLANVEQKHVHQGFDVCNDDCCQRYQGTTHLSNQSIEGAMNTRGQVLMYKGDICDARYSKSCGGVMETFENIWEETPLDYMRPLPDAPQDFENPNLPLDSESKVRQWISSVPNTFCSPHAISEKELKKYLGSVDEEGSYFRWEFYFTQEKITRLMNKKLKLDADNILDIIPVKRGYSGRLTEIKILYLQKGNKKEFILKDQYFIRQAFHESFLYSSAFVIDKDDRKIPEYFELRGAGWGHGAGYCQIGAVGMALKGYATDEILYHYFPGSELKQIYK